MARMVISVTPTALASSCQLSTTVRWNASLFPQLLCSDSDWTLSGYFAASHIPIAPPVVRFDAFELDTRSGELRKHGRRIRLPEQAFQVLTLLLARPGEVVLRGDLQQRLWPTAAAGDFDSGLNNAVKKLRDALGDSAEAPRLIETVPRRGYRFLGQVVAPVQSPSPEPEAIEPEPVPPPAVPPPKTETPVDVLAANDLRGRL